MSMRDDVFDDLDLYDETLAYEELKAQVDEEYKFMSEDEKHFRSVECSPTFKQFYLSAMKPGQTAFVNEFKYEFKIL